MDRATELAIRAVICGLYHGGVLDVSHLRSVMQAIRTAQRGSLDRQLPETAAELDALVMGIVADTAVDE